VKGTMKVGKWGGELLQANVGIIMLCDTVHWETKTEMADLLGLF
jgi:hypothetical protein